LFVGALVAAVLAAAAAGFAVASPSAGDATIKTFAPVKVVINKYVQEGDRFVPGTVRMSSGSELTFTFGDREEEPHTLTIVRKAELPKTVAQIENCRACQKYATPHLKNPKAPPDQNNPIVHWTLDKGQPGLDAVGDSLAIQPGRHKTIKEIVSAPAGTTLYFVCAVHPWMQGKILVTS
jgi:plastocyanin